VLATAHLDQDPGNNALRNLAALCQRCQLAHDRPAHRRQRWITSSAAAHSATCSAVSIPKRADAMDHESLGTLAKFCQKLHHPLMTTMNVSLPETMKRFIDAQVEGRGFGTSSEYVRALIRNEQEREQLRELLLAGAASVPAEPTDTIWFVPLSPPVTAEERNCPDMRFEQQGLALLSRPVAEAEDRISLNNEVGSMTLQRVR